MNKGSQVESVSLSHAKFRVIECLKNRESKTGLTQLQLEKKTNLTFNDALINFLLSSDNIEYNEKNKKWSYKFLHELNNKEQLLQLLSGPNSNPILVDDDIMKRFEISRVSFYYYFPTFLALMKESKMILKICIMKCCS